jgi:hypothetical protein
MNIQLGTVRPARTAGTRNLAERSVHSVFCASKGINKLKEGSGSIKTLMNVWPLVPLPCKVMNPFAPVVYDLVKDEVL